MISNSWLPYLREEFSKPYYKSLYEFIKNEYSTRVIYPPSDEIFSALEHTPIDKVKVVILGQDPYHEPGQALGMSFSVKPGVKTPPSLQNMYKELKDELGLFIPNNGYLVKWADQGVLLLNTVLTVRRGEANSHKGKGWEQFTDAAIRALSDQREHIVFILWGSYAIAKQALINPNKHLILKSVHPSPLSASRGFFGCHHFSLTNTYLKENGIEPIDWTL